MTTKTFDMYQVDAFSDEVFKGNPAAVVPLQEWLPDEVLCNIAMENNLAETAFFIPAQDENFDFEIRWFTPTTEVELCGHATLASCYVMWEELGWDHNEIRLSTREAGPLFVKRSEDFIELDLPSRPVQEIPALEGFVAAHNIVPISYHRALKNLVVLEGEAEVTAFEPNMDYIASLPEGDGLIVTARGDDCDCVSRYFAPASGIPEDPVTGSAHCSIIPFWSQKLGKKEIHARQLSKRSGDLFCLLEGDRVKIKGKAFMYLKGQIYL